MKFQSSKIHFSQKFSDVKVDSTDYTIFINGEFCRDKDNLFSQFARSLQFPFYFGFNWDALYDCLEDLSWLRVEKVNLFLENFDLFLLDKEKDFEIFCKILIDTIIQNNSKPSDSKDFDEPCLHVFIEKKFSSKMLRYIDDQRLVTSD